MGFTLIELLVVIALISVLSAGVIPTLLSNTDGSRLRDSTQHIGELVGFCNSMAAFEGKTFRLNIDVDQRRFWLTFERSPLEAPGEFEPFKMSGYTSYVVEGELEIQDLVIEPEHYEALDEEQYIEFHPDGTSDAASFVLATEDGDGMSIILSPLTGQVRVRAEKAEDEDDMTDTDVEAEE